MPHVHDVAITLRHIDYSETSQVLVVFGRTSGKVRLIAKGIKRSTKKRFATGIDLLEMGELVYSHRRERPATMATLVEWKQTTIFPGLRMELPRLFGGQYLAEVTEHLIEDRDPHEELFDALERGLRALETAVHPLCEVVRFQVCLLREIGLYPDMGCCVECKRGWNREPGWQFSSHNGGLVCRDCEGVLVEKRRVREGSIELLGEVRGGGPSDVDGMSRWIGAFDVLDYHIAHVMGRAVALAEFVVPQAKRRVLG